MPADKIMVDESTNKECLGDTEFQTGLQYIWHQISHFDGGVYDFPNGVQAHPCPPPFIPFQLPSLMPPILQSRDKSFS